MKISGQNGELGEDWWSLMLKIQQLGGSNSKESACQCRRPGFDHWVGKIPWRRAWQSTPVFLPRESPWTEEPGGLQSMGSQRVRHNWATKHSRAQDACTVTLGFWLLQLNRWGSHLLTGILEEDQVWGKMTGSICTCGCWDTLVPSLCRHRVDIGYVGLKLRGEVAAEHVTLVVIVTLARTEAMDGNDIQWSEGWCCCWSCSTSATRARSPATSSHTLTAASSRPLRMLFIQGWQASFQIKQDFMCVCVCVRMCGVRVCRWRFVLWTLGWRVTMHGIWVSFSNTLVCQRFQNGRSQVAFSGV